VTGSGGGNTAPAAEATATPTDPTTGQPVAFSAAGSTDAETPGALTYAWRFGDGTTANGVTATHAYASVGRYTARVTVTDPGGLTGTATVSVTVRSAVVTPPGSGNASVKPVAVIKVKPKRPGTDRKVRFVGKKSTGTGALTYAWNFHNGGRRLDGTGKKVKTFVRRAGLHMVTLTVTDSTGATAKSTVHYRVRHHHSHRAALGRAVGRQLSRQLAGLF
jgi:PKD repeat protein